MTNWLLRTFIKNSDRSEDPKVRAAIGILSGIVGIVCNVLLCGGKLAVGIATGSVSITADAMNNLSDATSSVVTMLGFRLAERPADEEHPFGHARYEYLSGLAVSALILIIGVELAKSSLDKVLHPAAVEFGWTTAAVLVGSILVKLWMSLFTTRLSKTIHSATLAATEYRSKKELDGPVRLVEAGGDCCACCGTHLARTGEVGLIKIISAQHYKTGMRLAVACGQRAYDAVAAICADAEAAGRVLSAPAGSLTPSVENRQNGEAVLKQRIAALQNALADAYVQAAAPDRPAVLWAEGADGDGLRRIAMAVCAGINQVACVLAPGGQGLSYALAAPDGTDARALGRALNEAFAGRGGGKPAFCQGSLAQPGLTPDVVREKLSTLL